MKWSIAVLLPFLILTNASHAERKSYIPDPPHSQINFVGESLLISAQGYFERWESDFQIDREKLENSSIGINIDAASLNTRVQMRDNHLRSKDFLDVATYPQIKFTSTGISKVDDKNYVITGNLTLHGVTKPIKAPFRVIFLRDSDGRFKGEFKINRWDYGINYAGKMNPVEDMVTIQFDMHLQDKVTAGRQQKPADSQGP
jgi:polyisoprenoid-binding protein YceI